MKTMLNVCALLIGMNAFGQSEKLIIEFPEDLASLSYKALTTLNNLGHISAIEPFSNVEIIAITNECKNMEKARRLSLRRAENIEAYLNAIHCSYDYLIMSEVLPSEYDTPDCTMITVNF